MLAHVVLLPPLSLIDYIWLTIDKVHKFEPQYIREFRGGCDRARAWQACGSGIDSRSRRWMEICLAALLLDVIVK